MNNPLVSVIVPCYKKVHFLPKTLNSILNQTYNNWECIIVDNGSPDNTVEVANFFASRDRRFKILSQENQGLAMARNNGIAASRGYFILPLDSDDMIESTYLEKAVDYFKKRPDYDNTVGYNPNMKGLALWWPMPSGSCSSPSGCFWKAILWKEYCRIII